MHEFSYRNGELYCEGVSLEKLASQHGTPLYVYSAKTIRDHYRRLDQALAGLDHRVCFAMKANSNLAVLDLLAREGAGFDIVSGGELFRVIKAGGRADACTFAGVGKTREEIEYALEQGVYSFNVESEAELEFINEVAGAMGKKAPVALRVNPDVDAQTHKYISTGKSHNKFGIGIDRILGVYAAAAKLPHLKIRGIQTHIGSDPRDETIRRGARQIGPDRAGVEVALRYRVLQHRRRRRHYLSRHDGQRCARLVAARRGGWRQAHRIR